jgi:Uma2 family endonuclease
MMALRERHIAAAGATMSTITPIPSQPVAEPAWDIARLFPDQGFWSEEDYFLLKTNQLVELSDGQVEVLPVATRLHQAIVILMCNLLRAFVTNDQDATVLLAPFSVRLADGRLRQPDVLYMSGPNAFRCHERVWEGADLVVEVVSEDDRDRDLKVKKHEYALAGIPEYWIIDPELNEITVLALAATSYRVAGVYRQGEVAASVLLPGFVVDATAVFTAK